MSLPGFLSYRSRQTYRGPRRTASVGPDTFFCRTSQWGYATPRPPPRSSSGPGLEYGYYSQEPQYHYHDNDHHSDGDQVVGAHWCAFLEIHPAPGGLPLRDEPREQHQDQKDQDDDHKYWYEPSPHFLTSLVIYLYSSNKRQREHDRKDYHQDDHQYGESPVYPPVPRSLFVGDRLAAIYTL